MPHSQRVRIYVLDITERKQAEIAMRRQNEYLVALHDTTLGLITRLDLNNLLKTLVTRAGQLLDTPHGYIFLVENGAGQTELEVKVGVGALSQVIGYRTKMGVMNKIHFLLL